jgi:hypothetical protein
MVPCVSIDWLYLRRVVATLLPVVFIPLAAADVVASFAAEWLGADAHLYYRASSLWLSGGNPYDAVHFHLGRTFHYVALPTTTVIIAPFTLIPESVFVPCWVAVQALAAVFVVRRLELRWWWLAFPPLVHGVLAGNPSPVLLALLLAAHPLFKALAVLLKVYAVIPLLGERRWGSVLLAGFLGLVTVAVAPSLWIEFIRGSGGRTDRLLVESTGGFSAYGNVPLMIGAVVALVLIGRRDLRAAGWLAPIALWPGSQVHWSTLAMPLLVTPMAAPAVSMAYLLALPAHGLPPIAVMVYAVIAEVQHYRSERVAGRSPGPQTAG